MTLTFVIPVKNDAGRLRRCLEAIRRDAAAAEIIVADNGSTDDSREVAAAVGARVLLLPGLRVSELRNRAAGAASGDVLAFVDADHRIAHGWSSSVVDLLADASVGAAGALYLPPADGSWVQRMYGALRGRTVGRHEAAWLGSGNLAVRRSAFEAIRGFDETLEACEDVDFCQRLRKAGWRLVADDRLESIHDGDPATLRALFRAERWRGRDNIRVSLRGPLTWREVPSVAIPILQTAASVALAGSVLLIPIAGATAAVVSVSAASTVLALTAIRAARMIARGSITSPAEMARAFVVALTYDLARAAALMTRAPHHRHQTAQAARA